MATPRKTPAAPAESQQESTPENTESTERAPENLDNPVPEAPEAAIARLGADVASLEEQLGASQVALHDALRAAREAREGGAVQPLSPAHAAAIAVLRGCDGPEHMGHLRAADLERYERLHRAALTLADLVERA